MPRLTEATAAKRRAHILQAAMRRIYDQGLLATSVDDVCAEAAISKGAFYSHFPSKEALIYAVTDMLSDELGPLDSTSLERFATSIFERQIEPAMQPTNARFGIEMMAASIADDGLRERLIANLERFRASAERAMIEMEATGIARTGCDPAGSALTLQANLLGILCRNSVWTVQDGAAVRRSMHRLVNALLAPTAEVERVEALSEQAG